MEGNMAHPGRISRLLPWLVAFTLSCGLCGLCRGAEEPPDEALTANALPGVAPFDLDYLSGSMALHALHSVLTSQGYSGPYSELVGISGSPFKVVYDSSDAFEPLRDACPFDLLRTAAVRIGFPDAHWETGHAKEALKQIVKHEIDAGRALVAPFLKPDAYHGFNVITGYDFDLDQFKVQGAFDRRRPYSIPIPDSWDGPTLSPAGWATNPVFVLGEAWEDSAAMAEIYVDMADQGIDLLEGGILLYGLVEGEARYMAEAGLHEAHYGIPAYDVMAWDVVRADIAIGRAGRDSLNFAFLWRVDAMVGLLEHDRMGGGGFASLLRGELSQRKAAALHELVVNFQKTAEDAAALRSLFWHEVPDTLADPLAVGEYADGKDAIVFALPDRQGLAEALRDMGRDVYRCPWGWAMVEDSREKRIQAKMKVIGMRARDRECLDLMREIAEDLRASNERQWPQRKWRPRRPESK
jgi:hypothetical protein